MALAATVVWEVETGGSASDNNGGGFNPSETSAGTDYTYGVGQTVISWLSAGGTYTNDLASTTGTKVISSASRNFVAADVGNFIHISAGTHFTSGWYEIKSVATNKATLDREPTDGSNASVGSGYLGGALASPAMATSLCVGKNTIWVKSGTYVISSASQNVSGGCPLISVNGGGDVPTTMEGYETTRGDLGTKPILRPNLAVTYIWEATGNYAVPRNLALDGTVSNYASYGIFTNGTYNRVEFCSALGGCTTFGIAASLVVGCVVTACNAGISATYAMACEVYSCTGTGTTSPGILVGAMCVDCISSGNAGIGFYAGSNGFYHNCVAYGNASYGFNSASPSYYVNCHAESNGTSGTVYGFFDTGGNKFTLLNCSGYGNFSGDYSSQGRVIGFISPGASVFVSAATGNFALNNTASAGALLRAAGYPATFPRGTTANYRDIGAAQSQIPTMDSSALLVLPVSYPSAVSVWG